MDININITLTIKTEGEPESALEVAVNPDKGMVNATTKKEDDGECFLGNSDGPLKVGDLVTVHDVRHHCSIYRLGDVGLVKEIDPVLVDFNNQRNPYVTGEGVWYIQSEQLTKLDMDKL